MRLTDLLVVLDEGFVGGDQHVDLENAAGTVAVVPFVLTHHVAHASGSPLCG